MKTREVEKKGLKDGGIKKKKKREKREKMRIWKMGLKAWWKKNEIRRIWREMERRKGWKVKDLKIKIENGKKRWKFEKLGKNDGFVSFDEEEERILGVLMRKKKGSWEFGFRPKFVT